MTIRPPIDLAGTDQRLGGRSILPDAGTLEAISQVCEIVTDIGRVAEASRDWWPIAMHWSLAGAVARRGAVVARPTTTDQVAAVLAIAHRTGIPVTAAGGRSGVSGGAVPLHAGIVLDLTGLNGVVEIDPVSHVVGVRAGTFGPDLEAALGDAGLSLGHFPQSFDISTVGGWIACRGAGQYSTRYGKIEDMVVGLEVVLADGRVIRTGGAPAAAAGPDLDHLFIGSEGTLGVVTTAWLRVHPTPAAERRAAYRFGSFTDGIDACRRIVQSGATPAVLRLYDAIETARSHGGDGEDCALLVLDEGEPAIIDATMQIVARSCADATVADVELVEHWLQHRNDTSALQALTERGVVVDTMEVAGPWSKLAAIYTDTRAALMAVDTMRAASCHLSHSYADGACLYFSFAARPAPEAIDSTYVAMWDAAQRAALAAGANLSHHHGVGLNRSRYMAEALGGGHGVLAAIKQALDPMGILNPGKLGLPSPFGEPDWPPSST